MRDIFWIFFVTLAGIILVAVIQEYAPSPVAPEDVVRADSTEVTIMLMGMRDDSTHVTERDGIYHGYIDGKPALWGFVPKYHHVLVLQPMTGAPFIVLGDSTRVVIDIINTRGRP